ncbi:MAG: RluA family pseudouridine synthase [Granulosicoccus sp.]
MSATYPLIPCLPVLLEDEYLLVVNKPSGMLSQPGKTEDGSVLTRVQESGRSLHGPVLVHRLDMDTSGLLVLAKTRNVHRALQQQFEKRKVRKRYRARLERAIDAMGGRVHLPVRLDVENRPTQIVCPLHGKLSTTLWHRADVSDARTIALYPITGRTHQLRVHSASAQGLGIPICGDRLYGSASKGGQNSSASQPVTTSRLLLHADFLEFEHPVLQTLRSIASPAPF